MNRYNANDFEGWSGNIDRRNLREMFYKLGDNQAKMLLTIG